MKNVLSHKQMHQLNIWVSNTEPCYFETYKQAANCAKNDLNFLVTYSNLKSSEGAT